MQLRYVVFDLDRTLVRSDHLPAAWERACHANGVSAERGMAALHQHMGMPAAEIFALLGVPDPRAAAEQFNEAMEAAPPVAFPGADAALRQLAAHGVRMFLSTGSHPPLMHKVLVQHNWQTLFAVALGTSATANKGLEHYRRFSADDDAFGSHALAVGDGTHDMLFAAQAGVRWRCGISGGDQRLAEQLAGAGANLMVDTVADLPELLFDMQLLHADSVRS